MISERIKESYAKVIGYAMYMPKPKNKYDPEYEGDLKIISEIEQEFHLWAKKLRETRRMSDDNFPARQTTEDALRFMHGDSTLKEAIEAMRYFTSIIDSKEESEDKEIVFAAIHKLLYLRYKNTFLVREELPEQEGVTVQDVEDAVQVLDTYLSNEEALQDDPYLYEQVTGILDKANSDRQDKFTGSDLGIFLYRHDFRQHSNFGVPYRSMTAPFKQGEIVEVRLRDEWVPAIVAGMSFDDTHGRTYSLYIEEPHIKIVVDREVVRKWADTSTLPLDKANNLQFMIDNRKDW